MPRLPVINKICWCISLRRPTSAINKRRRLLLPATTVTNFRRFGGNPFTTPNGCAVENTRWSEICLFFMGFAVWLKKINEKIIFVENCDFFHTYSHLHWMPLSGRELSVGISLGTIENHAITEAVISVIFAVCRDFYQMPWFCWFPQILQYLFSINCNLCCDFITKLILLTIASRPVLRTEIHAFFLLPH